MLTINIKNIDKTLFVRLKGELTKDTIDKLNKRVTKKIETLNNYNIVFNVSKLKKIDYKGINKLLYNYEIVKTNKGKVLLCGNNINISNKIKKSRLLNYINEIKDELCVQKKLIKG